MPNFFNNMRGLLDSGMALDLGTGLLAQSGWSATPVSFGQALGGAMQFANGRQMDRFALEAARQKMEQDASQRSAMKDLAALMGANLPAGTTLPAAPNVDAKQFYGLMAMIAPEQFGQFAINQASPKAADTTATLTEMRAMGIDPASPEGRQHIINKWNGGPLGDLDMALKLAQLESFNREAGSADAAAKREKNEAENAVLHSLRVLTEAAQLNEELFDTAYETGVGLEELRRSALGGWEFIKRQFGIEDKEARELAAKFDRYEQLTTGEAVKNIEILRGTGTISNEKFQTLLDMSPGPSRSYEANRQGIADMIEAALEASGSLGMSLDDSQARSLILQLRGGTDGDLTPEELAELEALRRQQGGL